jgi:hypothetical protein
MSLTYSHSQKDYVTMVRRNVYFAHNRPVERCRVAILVLPDC